MAYGEPTYGESGEVYTDKVRNSLAYVKNAAETAQATADNAVASVITAGQTADQALETAEAAKAYVATPTDERVAGLVGDAASATGAALSATFVPRGAGSTAAMSDNPADTTALARLNNITPVNKRVLQIRQDAAQYAVKIDHYGSDGHAVDIATHTDAATDPDYTVVGVTGYNTDFGTVKVVNNAPQTGGAVVAAWGTDPARTAPIFVADNWGKGDGFQSVHKAGSDAVAFRAFHDPAATFTKPVVWLPVRNTSNDVILVENAAAQTSGSLMYLNQQSATSTAPNIRLANAGSGYLIDATADGFSVDGNGYIRTTQIFNIASFNNAKFVVGTTGTQITRSVADANAVLRVRQDSATSTGDLLTVETTGSVVRSRFNKAGAFVTKVNAAPADADLAAGEMAVWFDSTNGAAKLMVKAKQADGTVKTGSVALS